MDKRRTVRKLLITMLSLALVFMFTACGGGSSAGDGSPADSQDAAVLSFETTDVDGNPVCSEDIFAANKVTMINIWGTFCGPCVEEMPEIQKISEKYASQGAGVIGLVSDLPVGDDTNLADAMDIINTTGVKYLNIRAWDGSEEVLPSVAVPSTYFVDSEGRIIGEKIAGAKLDQYAPALEKLLAEQ